MILKQWVERWGVPAPAVYELMQMMGMNPSSPGSPGTIKSEIGIQQQVRLEASKCGIRLWRNNTGVAINPVGQPVRYGLGNDSRQMNSVIKSSDLIGITIIGGMGVFTAYEVKKPGWKFTGTPRETAQLKYIQLVISMGGIAKFITSPEEIIK